MENKYTWLDIFTEWRIYSEEKEKISGVGSYGEGFFQIWLAENYDIPKKLNININSNNMEYSDLLKLYKKAEKIIESNLSWEDKYDMIFSEDISKKVKFDWYDPDTSYQEDVLAFMSGFENYVNRQSLIR